MSKKYVIDLPDDAQYILINGASENHCYTRVEQVDDLEELNSDYINEHYGELQDEAYQRGLDDAWEAAQRVVCRTEAGGMTLDTLQKVFGVISPVIIMQSNTAQEAIDKIKAYEDGKHSDRIEVGDEVISDTGTKFTVTGFTNSDAVCGFSARGLGCFNTIDKLTKTGKHYDIQSILEAMRK